MEGKDARRIRLGMVGGGTGAFIGAVHRLVARMDGHYELLAGALSADPARARSSAAALGIAPERTYDDFREMARREAARADGIDVVAIVTPNHLHHPIAMAFLDAGIHVICDKPLTTTVGEAVELVQKVRSSGLLFALTHNYTGFPLVRQAREMVAAGELGEIRVIQVEYPQDWLATPLEHTGHKQADWRTDPARSGAGGCVGDLGTHAFNLAAFMSGLELRELAAEATTFIPGRRLDDHVQVMLRYEGGARGLLWASQVATGSENGLRVRLFGTRAGLDFEQENPNQMRFTPLGEPPRLLRRAGPGLGSAAAAATRIPPGHPEGYLEGFAQIYTDFAQQLRSRWQQRTSPPHSLLVPTVEDGARGVKFISAVLESSQKGGAWVDARLPVP